MNFDLAYELLLGHEGGYVNDPRDPGGQTKYGISQRAYPGEDIAAMTLDRAKSIYRRDYWGPAGCDLVPDQVRFDLFDAAVNGGVKPAIKLLQRAAGVPDDGVIGPQTMLAISATNPDKLHARLNGWRLDFLNDLPTWPAFGKGWTQRIAENLKRA